MNTYDLLIGLTYVAQTAGILLGLFGLVVGVRVAGRAQ